MFTDPLYHFYIIEGNEETHGEVVGVLKESHDVRFESNPDLYEVVYDGFGIEESRLLKDFFSTRSFGEGKKVALVRTPRMTREAQNALLKISEEPAPGQHLFLIIPSSGLLIDTLKSRAQIIVRKNVDGAADDSFLKLSIPERLKIVQKIATKKDKEVGIELLDTLIAVLKKKKMHAALAEVYQARSYIGDQSSSLKLILEHISLILPV